MLPELKKIGLQIWRSWGDMDDPKFTSYGRLEKDVEASLFCLNVSRSLYIRGSFKHMKMVHLSPSATQVPPNRTSTGSKNFWWKACLPKHQKPAGGPNYAVTKRESWRSLTWDPLNRRGLIEPMVVYNLVMLSERWSLELSQWKSREECQDCLQNPKGKRRKQAARS